MLETSATESASSLKRVPFRIPNTKVDGLHIHATAHVLTEWWASIVLGGWLLHFPLHYSKRVAVVVANPHPALLLPVSS